MTTIVKSVMYLNQGLLIEPITKDVIRLRIDSGGASIHVPRADLVNAVEAECDVRLAPADAVVILRGELPEVTSTPPAALVVEGIYYPAGGVNYRRQARHHLAMAEYLDAHPPVDEAMVEAIASEVAVAFGANRDTAPGWEDIARRLYLAGVRIEPTEAAK